MGQRPEYGGPCISYLQFGCDQVRYFKQVSNMFIFTFWSHIFEISVEYGLEEGETGCRENNKEAVK